MAERIRIPTWVVGLVGVVLLMFLPMVARAVASAVHGPQPVHTRPVLHRHVVPAVRPLPRRTR
ncbi:hypothetical protein [Actinocatenispora rupis]|uniref:Uncharacterized protein n=1 Tax=Actinocatenispora rupis TaxID=519421 RepID=A0A8J3J1L2_9ACTN|nr:hypothetical protein [Actinocatenispora rupis]GID12533.1 hypothetical protein Aru02nite_34220 [Actinocatenispora rupis]